MFKKYEGGATVKGGYFWNGARWEIVPVDGKRGTLPGGPTQKYIRLPALALVPLALGFSALYVILLPFIGLTMALGLVVRKARTRQVPSTSVERT